MKVYLAIKFKEDFSDRQKIESLSDTLESIGISTTIAVRDIEKWGANQVTATELMEFAFKSIDEADMLVIEFSEKGVGLGIVAGYAYARKKPIVIIAKKDSDISTTIQGVARHIIFYDSPSELSGMLKQLKWN
jgi:nucleoside 2-deoxyribosyltransferase